MIEEHVLWVDEQNQVIGSVPRSKMRTEGLCHRAVYIFVFNSSGQLLVQERTLTRDIFPGYFDIAAGGVVAQGESYDLTAYRELEEELGISGVSLTPQCYFYFHGERCQLWGRVYSCCYDGALRLQQQEVAAVVSEYPDEIRTNRYHRRYTPDSLAAFERLMTIREAAS